MTFFVCGDIIEMHTIHESNYTWIREAHNGNSLVNKIFFKV